MPSKVYIHVGRARNLPIMDKASKLTDAYVQVEVAGNEQRTQTQRKTLDPEWNEDFCYEVTDDALLQNTPVEFTVMDMDVYVE
jgi:Ca2+-dependent lipid-binding protein